MVNTWESLRFLAVLSSPAHKCILKWSNLFWWRVTSKQWLPGDSGEHARLHLDMSTERTTSPAQANWFARGWTQPEQPSPCWLSSRGAQQHSGLDPPLQAESDVLSPRLTTCTVVPAPLLLALCEFTLLRENDCPTLRFSLAAGGSSSWTLSCAFSSFLSSFGTVGTGGILVSSKHMNPTNGWWKQWELLEDLRPPERSTHLTHQYRSPVPKNSNAAQHRLTGGQQPARQGVPPEGLWSRVPAATEQYLQHGLTDPHKIPQDGYRGTAFCHPLPLVSARGHPPFPWNSPNVSLRPCAAHRLEKIAATSGWWGEAQTVTMAKCPTCSWQGSHHTPASPRAGW